MHLNLNFNDCHWFKQLTFILKLTFCWLLWKLEQTKDHILIACMPTLPIYKFTIHA